MTQLDLLDLIAGPPNPPADWLPSWPIERPCNCRPGTVHVHEQGDQWCRLEPPSALARIVYRYAKGATA